MNESLPHAVSNDGSSDATRSGGPLVCAECGVTSPPDAPGWKAYLDDESQAVTF
jgi:hypothetical protein